MKKCNRKRITNINTPQDINFLSGDLICLPFIQEPASMAFSALNLALHFHGWMSFFTLLYNKLPLKASKRPYYEYASLWHVYGLLSLNSWFWSTIFHSR